MPLSRNKRGIEESTLAEIALLLLAFIILISIIRYIGTKAEESSSEKLCRAFNAIRYGTQLDKGPLTVDFAPRVCRTIDKENVPGKAYKEHAGGLKEGAKSELRDAIAKCWWMWLEGNQPDMFKTNTHNLQNKCFVCYTFSLDKEVKSLTIPELMAAMESPYEAIDNSNKCAPLGQGGYCMPVCDSSSDFPREIFSESCSKGQKCCITQDLKDECMNKGGICYYAEGYKQFPRWTCNNGDCYIKNENFASYMDYVQGLKGTGGPGFLAYSNDMEKGFAQGKKYAITLVSPGPEWTWETTGYAAKTAGTGITTLILTYYFPIFKGSVFAVGSATTGYLAGMTGKTGKLPGYNFIYLSEYDDLRFKCARELGIDEENTPTD